MSGALVPRSHALYDKLGENTTGRCTFYVALPSLNVTIVPAKDVYLPQEI